jgi:hypothetical protein
MLVQILQVRDPYMIFSPCMLTCLVARIYMDASGAGDDPSSAKYYIPRILGIGEQKAALKEPPGLLTLSRW